MYHIHNHCLLYIYLYILSRSNCFYKRKAAANTTLKIIFNSGIEPTLSNPVVTLSLPVVISTEAS